MGFAVGNERLIGALARVKSYLDYGAFTPIQVAAAAALNGPQDCVEEIRQSYKRRRDVLVDSFGRAGWDIPPPPATMFAWAPIPERFRSIGSVEFAKLLIEKADLAVSPGLGSESTARGSCASRWSRTSTAFGRRHATSRSSSGRAPRRCTTSFPIPPSNQAASRQ